MKNKSITDKKYSAEDIRLIETLKSISRKGHNAEVKQDRNGKWIIYDVSKERTTVG